MKNIYILSCSQNGGIYQYSFEDGRLTFIQKTPLDRPMYAVIRGNKMYVILREIDKITHFGGLLSFDIDENGSLINPTEIESTNGIVPCHLEVTDGEVYVTNYLSGNLVKVGEKSVTHQGKGVHPERQDAPHTHCVVLSPDGQRLFCTDLGVDKIFIYDKQLNEKNVIQIPSGSGPRHLIFLEDGRYLYCVNELSNTVSVIKDSAVIDTVSTVPEGVGESYAAAVRIKDNELYVSNRGADTISRFFIKAGKLECVDHTACGGVWPRDFEIVEDYIICTNEKSNSVTVLKSENGKLKLTDEKIEMECPLCVLKGEEI